MKLKKLLTLITLLSLSSLTYANDFEIGLNDGDDDEISIGSDSFRVLGIYSPGTEQIGVGGGSNSSRYGIILMSSSNNHLYALVPTDKEAGGKLDGRLQGGVGVRIPFFISLHAQAGLVGDMNIDFGENDAVDTLNRASIGMEFGAGSNFKLGPIVSLGMTGLKQFKYDITGNGSGVVDAKGSRWELMVLAGTVDIAYERMNTEASRLRGEGPDQLTSVDVELGRLVFRAEVFDKAAVVADPRSRLPETVSEQGANFQVGFKFGGRSNDF